MKTFFRVTVLALLLTVMTAFSATAIMAQTDEEQKEKTALYNCFVENYDKETIPNAEKAIDCAKKYVEKFPKDTQYVDYFKPQITSLQDWITTEKSAIESRRKAAERSKRLSRLNTAFNAIEATPKDVTKWNEYFAAGKDVLKYEPKFVDVSIVLASGGSEIPKEITDSKYSALTVKYANKVIQQLEAGTPSKKYGEFKWVYGSKDKVLTWMNVILGEVKSKTNTDAAIPYYYKATKYKEGSKSWNLYRLIGVWYRSKAADLATSRKDLDVEDDEDYAKVKEIIAMEKGFADRSIDAFARAYSLARADAKVTPKIKTALFNSLKELFAFRYSKKNEAKLKTDANINQYVSSVRTKTMPNPSTDVTPVKSAAPPSDKPADVKKGETKTTEMKSGATRSRTVSKKTDN